MSLELPFGIKPVNPVAVDYYSGPWSGASTQEAINAANSGIPSAVRFTGLTANLVIAGEAKKYWYASGITDSHLVNFGETLDLATTGNPSGVAFFDNSNLLTTDSDFNYDSSSNTLNLGNLYGTGEIYFDDTKNSYFYLYPVGNAVDLDFGFDGRQDGEGSLDVLFNVEEVYGIDLSYGGQHSATWFAPGSGSQLQLLKTGAYLTARDEAPSISPPGYVRPKTSLAVTLNGLMVGSYYDVTGVQSESLFEVNSKEATQNSFSIKGAISQSANLTEWKNSSNTVLAYVDPNGNAGFKNLNVDNMTVSGTFTYVNSENVTISDKQLELASNSGTAISGDPYVDQGGIVLKSTDGDKKWIWVDATNSWSSNQSVSVTGNVISTSSFQTSQGGYVNTDFINSVRSNFTGARIHLGNSIGGNNKIWLSTLQNPTLVATPSGVGLGTSTPGAALDIRSNGSGIHLYDLNLDNSNYERLELGHDGQFAFMNTASDGSGVLQRVQVRYGGDVRYQGDSYGSYLFQATNSQYIVYGNNQFRPQSDNHTSLGRNGNRWSDIYGYDLNIEASAATGIAAIIKGAVSQSANLTEWQNSAGETMTLIDASGDFVAYASGDASSNYRRLRITNNGYNTFIKTESDIGNPYQELTVQGGSSLRLLNDTDTGLSIGDYTVIHNTQTLRPQYNRFTNIGSTTYGYGDLHIESIFSSSGIKIFSSGDIAATDSEYFKIDSTNTARFNIGTFGDGNGDGPDLYIYRDGLSYLEMKLAGIQVIKNLIPNVDGSPNIGRSDLRFGTVYSWNLDAESHSATGTPLKVKGAAAQSANLTEWQNSAGENLAIVDSGGNIATSGDITVGFGGNTPEGSVLFPLTDGTFSRIHATSQGIRVQGYTGVTNMTFDRYFNYVHKTMQVGYGTYPAIGYPNRPFGDAYIQQLKLQKSQWANAEHLAENMMEVQNASGYLSMIIDSSGDVHLSSGVTQRIYRLGTKGDTNTEYLETFHDNANDTYSIRTGATGSGTDIRKIYIGTGFGGNNQRGLIIANSQCTFNFGGTRLVVKGGTIDSYANFSPISNAYSLGSDTKRWGNTYTNTIDVEASGATSVPAVIKGVAAQSANLTEWQDSNSTVMASIDPDGNFATSGDANISGVIYTDYIRNQFGNDITIGGYASNNIKINGSVWGSNTARMTSRGNTFTITAQDNFGNNLGYLILNGEGGTYLQYDGSTKLATTNSGVYIYEALQDQNQSPGVSGQHLISTGAGVQWSSSSGVPSGVSFYDANGALTSSSSFTYNGVNTLTLKDDATLLEFRGADDNLALTVGDGQSNTNEGGNIGFYWQGVTRGWITTSHTGTTHRIQTGYNHRFENGANFEYAFFYGTTTDKAFEIISPASTTVLQTYQGAAAQSANLTEWQNNAGNVLASVAADGSIATSGDIYPYTFNQNIGIHNTNVWENIYGKHLHALDITLSGVAPAYWQIKQAGGSLYFGYNGDDKLRWRAGQSFCLEGDDSFAIGSSTNVADVHLYRDAAGTWGQRDGYNSQQYNIYNYWGGDASNWERLETKWDNHTAIIQTAAAGSGVVRSLAINGDTVEIQNGGGTKFQAGTDNKSYVNLRPSSNGSLELGSRFLRWRTIFANGAYHGVISISADTTLAENNNAVLCDASSGTITVTLPASANYSGIRYHIKKTDSSSNVITISPDGSETIDGQSSYVVNNQYESITLVCDGSNWFII